MRTKIASLAIVAVALLSACGTDDVAQPTSSIAPTTLPETTLDHSETGMEHGEHAHDAQASAEDIASGFAELRNGHHAAIELVTLDSATQAQLDGEIAITQEVAELYPTVADAKAAGYRRAGPYSPGLGVHMVLQNGQGFNGDGKMDAADLRTPLSIIYSSHEDDGHIVGFMYYSMSGGDTPPDGFAGPNDFWHFHTSVCIVYAADGTIESPFGADRDDITDELCSSVGGSMLNQTAWMVHVWSVPGYEVADIDGGLFGESNRMLNCSDGSYHSVPLEDLAKYKYNACLSNPS